MRRASAVLWFLLGIVVLTHAAIALGSATDDALERIGSPVLALLLQIGIAGYFIWLGREVGGGRRNGAAVLTIWLYSIGAAMAAVVALTHNYSATTLLAVVQVVGLVMVVTQVVLATRLAGRVDPAAA